MNQTVYFKIEERCKSQKLVDHLEVVKIKELIITKTQKLFCLIDRGKKKRITAYLKFKKIKAYYKNYYIMIWWRKENRYPMYMKLKTIAAQNTQPYEIFSALLKRCNKCM